MVLATKYCVILAVGCAAILMLCLIRVFVLTFRSEEQEKEVCTPFGRIYSVVAVSGKSNQVWSPLGLKLMLAMLYAVEENKSTVEDLRNVLGWKDKREEDILHELKKSVDAVSTGVPQLVNISLVTVGFVNDQSENKLRTYENQIWAKYTRDIQRINLEDTSSASKFLNAWFRRETVGRINTLLSGTDYLDRRKESTRIEMVVANTHYFEAEWEVRFTRLSPKTKSPFYTDSSKKNHVPTRFYSTKGYFFHTVVRELSAEAARIPLKGGKFSIIAVLPYEWSDLASLEKIIAHGYQLTSLAFDLERKQMVLEFPELYMETTINFGEMLKIGGIGCGFEESKEYQSIKQIDLVNAGEMFQKTVLRVYNFKGLYPYAFRRSKVVMRFDRPFIGYILHESTNTIVMMFRKVN